VLLVGAHLPVSLAHDEPRKRVSARDSGGADGTRNPFSSLDAAEHESGSGDAKAVAPEETESTVTTIAADEARESRLSLPVRNSKIEDERASLTRRYDAALDAGEYRHADRIQARLDALPAQSGMATPIVTVARDDDREPGDLQ
jgi:hypothetical protein